MLENLTGYYEQADGQTKRKILGSILSEKLVFEKGIVATTAFDKCECLPAESCNQLRML